MRFGWLTLAHSGSPDGDYGAIQDLVAQACFAEAAGFDEIWLTEHNFTGESVYCDPIPFASVVAARTSRIRIGFAVIQLALRHPIRLATELALLDNLSNGRLDVGVGHGTNFNEYEFVGFGLRSDDSRERMEETLDVMVRAWTESPLVYDGKFYHLRLPGLAESGLDGERQARLREQAALWRFVHVADSQAQAEDELTQALLQTRRHMVHARETNNPSDFHVPASRVNPWNDPHISHEDGVRYSLETSTLYGTPARVAEQVAELRDAGVHHVLCQISYGYMPHQTIVESMRRFGEEVALKFR